MQALRATKTCNPTQARHHSETWVSAFSTFKHVKSFGLFALIGVVVEPVLSRIFDAYVLWMGNPLPV